MSASDNEKKHPDSHVTDIIANCRMGIKVLGGELKWMLTGGLRSYETRQVRTRLETEYATLGRLARAHLESGGKAPMSSDGEAGIVLSQITFLEKEIDFLTSDIKRTREEMLARRKREMDLEDD